MTVFAQRGEALSRLRDLGYVEGQNIDIISRYADADSARLPPFVT